MDLRDRAPPCYACDGPCDGPCEAFMMREHPPPPRLGPVDRGALEAGTFGNAALAGGPLWGGGGSHKASVSECLPLATLWGGGGQDAGLCCGLQPAAPIGLSPLYRCPSPEPSPSAAHRPPAVPWGQRSRPRSAGPGAPQAHLLQISLFPTMKSGSGGGGGGCAGGCETVRGRQGADRSGWG